jgi:hypothetical protein
MKFPTLYSLSSTGKVKVWSIETRDELIIISHGYEGGVQQVATRAAEEKNKGRSNATTRAKQAELEARSRWEKKQKQNYTIQSEQIQEKKRAHSWAMLALEYSKRGHDIEFPCFVQPKMDGTRACFDLSTGRIYRRGGDEIPQHGEIADELARLGVPFSLDGEMYSDKISFERLAGLMNKGNSSEEKESSEIKFHIFDCIAPQDFSARFELLCAHFRERGPFNYLVLTETVECKQSADVDVWLHHYIDRGFEGIMLRNVRGHYKGNGYRSKDLQKCKLFQDEEFEITGFKEGKGKSAGCVIWQCKTKEGKTFFVKPACSEKESRELLSTAHQYIGMFLTVKFQEITSKGVPRFPVAKCFSFQK